MYVDEPFFTWTHMEVILSAVGLIVIPYALSLQSERKERNKQHQENQDKLDALIMEKEYHPPHWHQEFAAGEADTPLTVGGIIRKPNGRT